MKARRLHPIRLARGRSPERVYGTTTQRPRLTAAVKRGACVFRAEITRALEFHCPEYLRYKRRSDLLRLIAYLNAWIDYAASIAEEPAPKETHSARHTQAGRVGEVQIPDQQRRAS